MSKKSVDSAPKQFVDALRELESIIHEVDSNDVDIDILESKLKRAAVLIAWCNERIAATEVVVEEIVANFKLMGGPIPARVSEGESEDDFDEEDDDEDYEDEDYEDD